MSHGTLRWVCARAWFTVHAWIPLSGSVLAVDVSTSIQMSIAASSAPLRSPILVRPLVASQTPGTLHPEPSYHGIRHRLQLTGIRPHLGMTALCAALAAVVLLNTAGPASSLPHTNRLAVDASRRNLEVWTRISSQPPHPDAAGAPPEQQSLAVFSMLAANAIAAAGGRHQPAARRHAALEPRVAGCRRGERPAAAGTLRRLDQNRRARRGAAAARVRPQPLRGRDRGARRRRRR